MNFFRPAAWLTCCLGVLAIPAAAASGLSTTARRFDVTLKPLRDAGGEVYAIQVHEDIHGIPAADGKPLSLSAPVIYPGAQRVADRVASLDVQDAQGPVPLKIEEDKPTPGGFPYYRHWIAQRPTHFPVSVTYLARVQPPGGTNGPAFGIRPSGGGVSGAGGGFLLLPDNAGTTDSHFRWDLSALPAGSVGVTSLGEGAFDLPGVPDKLNDGWMLAGPAHRYTPPSNAPFGAFWLGTPPFDMTTEMAWSARAYAYLGQSFGYLQPLPGFRVFVRVLDTPPYGGGTALYHSFMLSMGKNGPANKSMADIRETFFHEMTHQWVGRMDGPDGVVAWFEEGLTVYYTTVLPVRGGLVSVEAYGDLFNQQARDYYESPARNWSAQKIAKVGFNDEKIRETPYVRGALYFSALDAQIRKASHGRRDLDVFLHPMFVARLHGAPFNQQVWETMLTKELGSQAVADFRAELLDGSMTVVPDSDAFGPCFRRQAVPLLTKQTNTVHGYQWIRVLGVPEDKCRAWH